MADALFIPGANPFQGLALLRAARGRRLAVTPHAWKAASTLPFAARGAARSGKTACDFSGLWYRVNELALAALGRLRSLRGPLLGLPRLSSARLRSPKFAAYLQQHAAGELFAVLLDLHLWRLDPELRRLAVVFPDTPLHRFALSEFERESGASPRAEFIPCFLGFPQLAAYSLWLVRETLRRGFRWRRTRPRFALGRVAADGFDRGILSDDMLIDGRAFSKEDILFSTSSADLARRTAAEQCRKKGYATTPEASTPLNLAHSDFFRFYVAQPVAEALVLAKVGRLDFLKPLLSFRKESMAIDAILSNFDVSLWLSYHDWGDIALTAALNERGSRSALIQWSDMACYKNVLHSFVSHNLFYFWGGFFSRHHDPFAGIDRRRSIGCAFTGAVAALRAQAPALKRSLGLAGRAAVVFFDSTYSDVMEFGEELFLRYLGLVRDYARSHPDVDVLLKPKRNHHYDQALSPARIARFRAIWADLQALPNFRYLFDWRRDPEAAIALADVVVSMAMISPSTIALLSGIPALYFDDTDNRQHPLSKGCRGTVVFDDPAALMRRLDAVLAGAADMFEDLPAGLLADLDAGRDGGAVARARAALARELGQAPAPAAVAQEA